MAMHGTGAFAAPHDGLSRFAEDGPGSCEQRALVPVPETAPEDPPPLYSRRPAAPFLAHLIATWHGEPQTRERGRAKPEAAARAYAAGARL